MTERIDLSNRRVLLVDSSGNLRSTVKSFLESMGFLEVVTQNIGVEVLNRVAETAFDLILVGHNVHDRYSGLQLLEEARYKGLIKPTASWILMTSDASQESVLFAIENRPDDVITKPFTMESLRRRVLQLFRRKLALEPIERAIERQAFNRAIQLCDSLLSRSDPNHQQVQQVKGRLLMERGEFAAAREVFEQLYWADQSLLSGYRLAECEFRLGMLAEAEKRLLALVDQNPLLIPAYDLLVALYEARGEAQEAQKMLARAVEQSPRSIERQMTLGRLALNNKDLNVAERAYRRSVALSDQSCRASSDPFLKLANVTRLQMEQGAAGDRQQRLNAIEKLVREAKRKFRDEPDLAVRTELFQAKLEESLGNPDAAQQCYERAQEAAQKIGRTDLEQMKRQLLDEAPPKPQMPPVQAPSSRQERDPAMSDKVNRIGVRNYMADKQGQAIRYFNLAFDYNPANAHALLNLAQLFLEGARDIPGRREERLKMFHRYMRLAERLTLTGQDKEKFQQLRSFERQPLDKLPQGMLTPLLK